jgi:hypothetical protein
MDGILEYFEKKYPDLHVRDVIECSEPIDLNELSKEYCKEQLILSGVGKSLPTNRETDLKIREDLINEHYKDDPNKSTFAMGFITCFDWLHRLCKK